MALKMTEFSVMLFLDSPEFKRFFSEEMVFHAGLSDDFVADRFLRYVKDKREGGQEATKYDYLVNHLNKRNTHVRSFQNTMIEALKKAGVIQKEKTENGYTYSLGPNYQAYREGRLKPA
jgi:hypothetical protein